MTYLENYQIIKLEDNKEYVVMDSINYDNKNFVYIVNSNSPKDQTIAIASKDGDDLKIDILDYESEENKELIDYLSSIFISHLSGIDVQEVLDENN